MISQRGSGSARDGGHGSRRRARAAALRAEQVRRDRRRRGLVILAALTAALLVAGTATVLATRRSRAHPALASEQILPAASSGAVTVQQQPRRVPDTSGIPGVLAWDTGNWPGNGASSPGALEHQHVTGPVRYAVTPPVGGPHNPVWMNAGVYTAPVPSERAVHNLEHGAVWITYDPNLPAADIAELTAFVGRQTTLTERGWPGQSNRYLDLSPWTSNTLPTPVVISAWGHQLCVKDPRDPRLQRFVDTFRCSQRYSPEYGNPVDGIPVHTGGVPASDGSSSPNPPGRVSG